MNNQVRPEKPCYPVWLCRTTITRRVASPVVIPVNGLLLAIKEAIMNKSKTKGRGHTDNATRSPLASASKPRGSHREFVTQPTAAPVFESHGDQRVFDTHVMHVPVPDNVNGGHQARDTLLSAAPIPESEADRSQPAIANHDHHADICLQLRELQAHRIATVKAQLRLQNQACALARRYLGWQVDATEKARAKINRAATRLVKQIEKNNTLALDHPAGPFILATYKARTTIDTYRNNLEKEMKLLAESLPVWNFWQNIKGVGALGLAIIVGEAGNLSDYANPGKLWKRLGLAPPDCYLMTTKEGKEAKAIPKRRRSAIYTIGDSLIKGNRADGEPLEYTAVYYARKEYEQERDPEITKMKAHRRAQRYMEKRLIRNLWQAWQRCSFLKVKAIMESN